MNLILNDLICLIIELNVKWLNLIKMIEFVSLIIELNVKWFSNDWIRFVNDWMARITNTEWDIHCNDIQICKWCDSYLGQIIRTNK